MRACSVGEKNMDSSSGWAIRRMMRLLLRREGGGGGAMVEERCQAAKKRMGRVKSRMSAVVAIAAGMRVEARYNCCVKY